MGVPLASPQLDVTQQPYEIDMKNKKLITSCKNKLRIHAMLTYLYSLTYAIFETKFTAMLSNSSFTRSFDTSSDAVVNANAVTV